MPTKPSDLFPLWATDLNFSSGPANGLPTKIAPLSPTQGFVPGTGIAGEQMNHLMNRVGQWLTDWLALGTSVADLDAHVIETDVNGRSRIAALTVGLTASTLRPLRAENNTGANVPVIDVIHSGGDTGINLVTFDPTFACIEAEQTANDATSRGLFVENTGTSGAAAVFESVGGVTPTVSILNQAVGVGPATFIAGGTGGGNAIEALSNGSAITARLLTGGNALALSAERASGSTAAVAEFLSGGAGVPTRGTINVDPTQDASAPTEGDLWLLPGLAGFGRGQLRYFDADGAAGGGGSGKQVFWSTAAGVAAELPAAVTEGITTLPIGPSTTTVQSLTMGFDASPGEPAGVYLVWFSATFDSTGAAHNLDVRFKANGATVQQDTIDVPATAGREITVSTFMPIAYAGGAVTLAEIEVVNNTAATIDVAHRRIAAIGAFE